MKEKERGITRRRFDYRDEEDDWHWMCLIDDYLLKLRRWFQDSGEVLMPQAKDSGMVFSLDSTRQRKRENTYALVRRNSIRKSKVQCARSMVSSIGIYARFGCTLLGITKEIRWELSAVSINSFSRGVKNEGNNGIKISFSFFK